MTDSIIELTEKFKGINLNNDVEVVTSSNGYVYDHSPKVSAFMNFVRLCNFIETTKLVHISILEDYPKLQLGNGHSWGRKDVIRRTEYKLFVVQNNGRISYRWDDVSDLDRYNAGRIVSRFCSLNSKDYSPSNITYFCILGKKVANNVSRPIRRDIKLYYSKKPCCVCGSTNDLECDHKNDLYNDPRVLDINTQTFDDFQSLCKHCNDQKRQICKKTKETSKRYGATNITSMASFGIDFVEGDEHFNIKDVNAMVGTYWYDPEYFNKMVRIITTINTTKEFLGIP